MSKSKDPNPVPIGGGECCPKCYGLMQRYEHSAEWKPLPGRNFYRYWDRCATCNHIQHYEVARTEP